jgi:molybdate transport system permease protein
VDWNAFALSLKLAAWTSLVLIPVAILLGRVFAWQPFRGRTFVEAIFALPLVLPPTVLGYYLLAGMGGGSPVGRWYEAATGHPLVFTFDGLLAASLIFNLPFAIQPVQRALEAIPEEVRHAAACCGMSRWRTVWRIELPLAWPGILSALVMTFAHTLGEFGVVLMVGGNIPGETRTVAIAIYDRVQGFDAAGAGQMSALLLALSLAAIGVTFLSARRHGSRHG